MSIAAPMMVISLIIYAGLFGLFIYLVILIIRALKKYIRSKDVRAEKSVLKQNLGEVLKDLRTKNRMTQEFVGETIGVSRQAVSKWENGLALPDITLIPALAGFFGVSADYLLEIDTEYSDKVIENVLGEVSRLKHIAKAEEGIALIEKTLRSYPNNHKLLAEWVELKVHTFETNCEKKEWLKNTMLLHWGNTWWIFRRADAEKWTILFTR